MKYTSIIVSALLFVVSVPALANEVSPLEACHIGSRGGDCNKAPSGLGKRTISYVAMVTGGKYRCSFQTGGGDIHFEQVSMRDSRASFGINRQMQGTNFNQTPQVFEITVHYVPEAMGLDITLRNRSRATPSMTTFCDKIN